MFTYISIFIKFLKIQGTFYPKLNGPDTPLFLKPPFSIY